VEQQRFWPGEFLVVFLSAAAFRALSRPFRQTVAGLNIDAAKIEATKDRAAWWRLPRTSPSPSSCT
jgi:hypothetical protein